MDSDLKYTTTMAMSRPAILPEEPEPATNPLATFQVGWEDRRQKRFPAAVSVHP
jgi:hypothetical protein